MIRSKIYSDVHGIPNNPNKCIHLEVSRGISIYEYIRNIKVV